MKSHAVSDKCMKQTTSNLSHLSTSVKCCAAEKSGECESLLVEGFYYFFLLVIHTEICCSFKSLHCQICVLEINILVYY